MSDANTREKHYFIWRIPGAFVGGWLAAAVSLPKGGEGGICEANDG